MKRVLSILLALGLVLSFSLVTAVPVMAFTEVWVDDVTDPLEDGTLAHPFDSIQEAITYVFADPEGGIVHVLDGSYNEDIALADGVDVLGAGASDTTIDGTGSGPVVTANGISSGTTFDGFTITDGDAGFGGGMYLNDSSPVVSNCVFTGNHADNNGGGMYNYNYSSPTVTNCIFTGNTANAWGGGILCQEYSSPTITNCVIAGNSATWGGGIYSHMTPQPIITNNTIVENTATNGGGIYVNGSINMPIITNNIIANNTATNGSGVYCVTATLSIDHNDVYPIDLTYLVNCTSTNDPAADPLFVGAGDYHLQLGSLCIDAGDNGALALPSTDFEGEPRIYPTGGTVDIGADEYYVAPPPPPPAPRGAVGGEIHPIDKVAILLPWLSLSILLILAAGGLILIRHLNPVDRR